MSELTVQVTLIEKLDGSLSRTVEFPAEHTYASEKDARADFELLSRMLEKLGEIDEKYQKGLARLRG